MGVIFEMYHRDYVNRIREQYPPGTRVEVVSLCNEEEHLKPGMKGTVVGVDDQPALFSHVLVTGLLREKLGFEGVVMTDGLQMKAMTDYYDSGEIAVKAVQAGVDLLLCPKDLDQAANALLQAVGGLPQAQVA